MVQRNDTDRSVTSQCNCTSGEGLPASVVHITRPFDASLSTPQLKWSPSDPSAVQPCFRQFFLRVAVVVVYYLQDLRITLLLLSTFQTLPTNTNGSTSSCRSIRTLYDVLICLFSSNQNLPSDSHHRSLVHF